VSETKFFDVECADASTYDFSQLRRIFKSIIGPLVKDVQVLRLGANQVRISVVEHSYATINWSRLQFKKFDHLGVTLRPVLPNGDTENLAPNLISPAAIPMDTIMVSPVLLAGKKAARRAIARKA